VNVFEVLVFVLAVRMFGVSALTICFGLASGNYTFDGSAFYVLFQKVSVCGVNVWGVGFDFGFTFKVRLRV